MGYAVESISSRVFDYFLTSDAGRTLGRGDACDGDLTDGCRSGSLAKFLMTGLGSPGGLGPTLIQCALALECASACLKAY